MAIDTAPTALGLIDDALVDYYGNEGHAPGFAESLRWCAAQAGQHEGAPGDVARAVITAWQLTFLPSQILIQLRQPIATTRPTSPLVKSARILLRNIMGFCNKQKLCYRHIWS